MMFPGVDAVATLCTTLGRIGYSVFPTLSYIWDYQDERLVSYAHHGRQVDIVVDGDGYMVRGWKNTDNYPTPRTPVGSTRVDTIAELIPIIEKYTTTTGITPNLAPATGKENGARDLLVDVYTTVETLCRDDMISPTLTHVEFSPLGFAIVGVTGGAYVFVSASLNDVTMSRFDPMYGTIPGIATHKQVGEDPCRMFQLVSYRYRGEMDE